MTKDEKNAAKRDFNPGEETREVFSKAISVLKVLISDKTVRFRIDADADVEPVVNMQAFKHLPPDRYPDGLTPGAFMNLLKTELTSLANCAVRENPKKAIGAYFPESVVKQTGEDEILWRIDELKKEALPDDLMERIKLRKSAKGALLDEMTWEISRKEHDETQGSVGGIPYANLAITYTEGFGTRERISMEIGDRRVFFPLGLSRVKRLTLMLHEADVEELIDKLSVLRDNLARMRTQS